MVCDNSVSAGQYERMNHIWSFINYSKRVHLILDMMSRMLRATASFFLGLTGAVAKQNLREKREKVRAFLRSGMKKKEKRNTEWEWYKTYCTCSQSSTQQTSLAYNVQHTARAHKNGWLE